MLREVLRCADESAGSCRKWSSHLQRESPELDQKFRKFSGDRRRAPRSRPTLTALLFVVGFGGALLSLHSGLVIAAGVLALLSIIMPVAVLADASP
ncbi:hypothetical protein SAMN02982929_00888 [Saccharopolyspora kobensis]|uniref:DUF3040 family protein n=1 Tax=Saccharopolyspora kobensis TaxID=146035 RepID=A0A1H5VI26_9PSEU|nr:hypothetical protein SAMN02982929_00888 [Saccharopolyspora kobensis]SFC60556.1 hypothetical protein SAMN05216506_1011182 [Saccharopolyspora kobensis]